MRGNKNLFFNYKKQFINKKYNLVPWNFSPSSVTVGNDNEIILFLYIIKLTIYDETLYFTYHIIK